MRVEIIGKRGEGKTTLAQLIIRAIRRSRKHTKIHFEDGETAALTITNFKNIPDITKET